MKAISLWQPWASAMALGWKRNETRHWATSYRGPLLIHAAKKATEWPSVDIQSLFDGVAFLPSDLPRGVVLCKVELVDCKRISVHNRPCLLNEGVERILGNYEPGRFMYITEKLETFDPIPYRGSQGFFDIPDELIEQRNIPISKIENQRPQLKLF